MGTFWELTCEHQEPSSLSKGLLFSSLNELQESYLPLKARCSFKSETKILSSIPVHVMHHVPLRKIGKDFYSKFSLLFHLHPYTTLMPSPYFVSSNFQKQIKFSTGMSWLHGAMETPYISSSQTHQIFMKMLMCSRADVCLLTTLILHVCILIVFAWLLSNSCVSGRAVSGRWLFSPSCISA